MTGFIAQTAGGENPVGSVDYNMLFAVGSAAVPDHAGDQRDQHLLRPSIQAGLLMTSSTIEYTREAVQTAASTGRSRDRNTASMAFLVLLWFSLFFGVMVLIVLIVNTAIEGAPRFDLPLLTRYDSTLSPERTGFRAASSAPCG